MTVAHTQKRMNAVIYKSLKFMRYPDYKVGTDGSVWSKRRGKWKRLKPDPTDKGHLCVRLFNSKGSVRFKVHRLVLFAFKGEPKPGQEGCHFPDSDPTNNNVDNLSWGSHKKNERHKQFHGTDNRGERHGLSKLTWDKVRKIRKLYGTSSKKTGLVWTQTRLGNKFHTDPNNIRCIVNNGTWKEEGKYE